MAAREVLGETPGLHREPAVFLVICSGTCEYLRSFCSGDDVIFEFNGNRLDIDRRELWRDGHPVTVEPGVFDLIEYLVLNRDRVISKDELIEAVWDGRIVSESTLTSRITAARQAIGDSGQEQRLIRTVARKGVRFVADLSSPATAVPDPAAPTLPPRTMDKPSIAVLPFTNMSGDPEQEYFSDGISEDIIMGLSRLRWFFVIARNSSFAYKGQALDVRQIGRELGVDYLLEGSVRKSGQRVRISCQLLDAGTGNHLWSERYDRDLTDVFALQDEITENVVAAIEPELVAAEGHRAERRSAEDLQAWDMVARALPHFWRFTAESSAEAIIILQTAVDRFPDYAPANSMLSFARLFSAYVGWSAVDRKEAESLAFHAMQVDEQDPWAHVAAGFLAMTDRRTEDSLRHYRRALELNPNFAAAIGFVGFTLALDGRCDEAFDCFQRATRMNPKEAFTNIFFAPYGAAYYLAGDYDEAIRWGRQAVQLRPGHMGGYRILAASLAQAGRLDEAREVMATLQRLQPEISVAWIREYVPYTDRVIDKFLEGMRKAGLPD
ncbi:tetratricopeptide repeat protein [Rhodobacterales bacterium HKCCE3408]|nr:tetratricopeptide repeat protein [Rhodobacterales bacterium HKCCE3408]